MEFSVSIMGWELEQLVLGGHRFLVLKKAKQKGSKFSRKKGEKKKKSKWTGKKKGGGL